MISNHLCECGCGQFTNIAPYNDKTYGWVKGQPLRFVSSHNMRVKTIEERPKCSIPDCKNYVDFYRTVTGTYKFREFCQNHRKQQRLPKPILDNQLLRDIPMYRFDERLYCMVADCHRIATLLTRPDGSKYQYQRCEYHRRGYEQQEERRKHKVLTSRLRRYGLTPKRYDEMLEAQKNCCAICDSAFTDNNVPNIDEHAQTREIQALLCRGCNTGIGALKHDPRILAKALEYVTYFYKIDDVAA